MSEARHAGLAEPGFLRSPRRSTPRRSTPRRVMSRRLLGFFGALVLLVVIVVLSLAIGTRGTPFANVIGALFSPQASNPDLVVIRDLRVPRTVIGIVVGTRARPGRHDHAGHHPQPTRRSRAARGQRGRVALRRAGDCRAGHHQPGRIHLVRLRGCGGGRRGRLRHRLDRAGGRDAGQARTLRHGGHGGRHLGDHPHAHQQHRHAQFVPVLAGRLPRQPQPRPAGCALAVPR